MGKGSQRRPMYISHGEYSLRWDFAHGLISLEVFLNERKKLKRKQTKKDRR